MTIEVTGKPTSGLTTGANETPTRRETATASNPGQSPGSGSDDSVNLTSTASALHRLERALASQPVVDLQRVQAIRKDLLRGAYEPDPSRVAEKMFMFERARSA